MLTRVSEALVKPGREQEFVERVRSLVRTFPDTYDGLEGHEVLVDLADPRKVQYVSRWRDEQSLENYAGPGWRTDPVTFPDEDEYLQQPLTLRHFQDVS
ncbi:antibiotic biosynthesis monooxygenase family protein [Lentzea aerocolonigenes]|uniref:antibiotic biosynthesis monooxygenase family protein n=1 Tax=Lentzea aerocolonigenes TaxID=68170 RepID=UPI0004C44082|nr:antibiotic biosynthesis monooxygenase family protein [Lentzea aerocolonigenes]MCP2245661.1 Antibiotic biosynthesis monooxygenase [Lentzea aerocolonigenes]